MTKENQKMLLQAAEMLQDIAQETAGISDYSFEDEAAYELEVTVNDLERIIPKLRELCDQLRHPMSGSVASV